MLDKKSLALANNIIHNKNISSPRSFIRIAANNRVLFAYSQRHKELSATVEQGEIWRKKLRDTVLFLKKNLPQNFLITRTYKFIPYVTFDVDVYVGSTDFNKTISLLKKAGCKIGSHDSSLGGRIKKQQINAFADGLLTIDLHRDFTWQKRRFLDTELVTKKTAKKHIEGVTVVIPSPEVEFLLCMADITHERFNITLLDIIWLEGLSKEISKWDVIENQVKKYQWERVFRQTAEVINTMTLDIYKKEIIPFVNASNNVYQLPYFLSFPTSWLSYLENILYTKHFPYISFAYMHYTRIRYYLSGKKRMPYYSDWYT